MDYKQNQFMRMQQYQYAPQMPFYMSYPQNIYMTELEYDRDMERMKELYPEEAKQIQGLVEEECDKLEYEGSMMFDEYPDRVMLKVICDRIYQKALQPRIQETEILETENPAAENQTAKDQETENHGLEAEQLKDQAFGPGRPPGPGWPPGPGRPPGPPPPPPGPGWPPGPPPPPGPGWPPGPGRPPGPPPPPPGRPNQGLGSLIEVLLYNEMYKRRCRHNRCRRWW